MSKNHLKANRLSDTIITAVYGNKSEIIADWVTGENVDSVDSDNRTALFHAVIAGGTDIVLLILDAKPNINLKDKKGWSPLHYAAQGYHVQIAEWLIERGADLEIRDDYGNTPLSRATFASQGKGEMIKLLLSKGADPDNANDTGVSPLALAKRIANYDVKQYFE